MFKIHSNQVSVTPVTEIEIIYILVAAETVAGDPLSEWQHTHVDNRDISDEYIGLKLNLTAMRGHWCLQNHTGATAVL